MTSYDALSENEGDTAAAGGQEAVVEEDAEDVEAAVKEKTENAEAGVDAEEAEAEAEEAEAENAEDVAGNICQALPWAACPC